MNIIITIIVGIFSFGFLIISHELGHYIMARLSKIRISTFSIGFGPQILSKKKNGITYTLSLLPIGGYVTMPEDFEVESSDGIPFSKSSFFSKTATLLAGSLSNIFFGYLILIFIFLFIQNGQINFDFSNIYENFMQANSFFAQVISIVFDSLKGLFTGNYGISDLSGPIGVTTIIGKSLDISIYVYLIMLSFISINIGIFNLLPIPSLDGSRALFCILELITNQKFSIKIQEKIHNTGLVALLCLIVIVTIKDINGLIRIL